MPVYDYAVVGGGIVGLSAALQLSLAHPDARLLLLEKEPGPARHQTGRNSGVIHSGIYYPPGSFKARFALAGAASMVEFCREHGLPAEVCGKIIVARSEQELPLLKALHQRGTEHGLAVEQLTPAMVAEHEPHVRCVGGIRVPTTGITDYRQVAAKYQELFVARGGTVILTAEVRRIDRRGGIHHLETKQGGYECRFLVNCAGLHSDRVAALAGARTSARIVPFRGEYFELAPAKRHLVRGLVYPVPNPHFPFLGVHFTRMIDGSVHVGPNAVLAFQREGYRKADVRAADLFDTLSYGGFWKLARKHFRDGLAEFHRSFSKRAFVRALQELVPEVQADDLQPCAAGVRAQALLPDGRLVDDFLFVRSEQALHVCNAPSPAATASLEIGRAIAAQVPHVDTPVTVAFSR